MAPSTSFEPFKIGERVISLQAELEDFLTPTYPDLRPPPLRRSVKQMTNGLAAADSKVRGAPTRPTDDSHVPHMPTRSRLAVAPTRLTNFAQRRVPGVCNSRKTERQRERRTLRNKLREGIRVYTLAEDNYIVEAYRAYAQAHAGAKIPRASLLKAYNKRFTTERTLSGLSNHISHNEELKQRIADAIRDGKPTKAKRGAMRSSRRA